jgi:preprotein translocase subunit SecF
MEFFKQTNTIDFMGKSKMAMLISIVLVLSSYGLLMTKGLNFGVDFAGGTIVQVKYADAAPIDTMRDQLSTNEMFNGASITEFGSPDEVIIRLKTTSKDISQDMGDVTREALKGTGDYVIRRVDIVGPKVGDELREKGVMSLLLAMLGILIYVAFRFEWRFAVASIIALVHDVSIATIAAVLTIIGYSLNDTIIVFDRIREGITDTKNLLLSDTINESVTKTLSRTTLTSLTTFFVVLTLFAFGGEIIHSFAFTLLVGVVVGTYSSIFVASPILMWLGFDIKNYHGKLAEKAKRHAEKEKMRAQFEQGTL